MQSDSVCQSQSSSAVIRARQALIDYIKRCCCAYVNHRMELIKRLRWKHGGILPNSVKVLFCLEKGLIFKNFLSLLYLSFLLLIDRQISALNVLLISVYYFSDRIHLT